MTNFNYGRNTSFKYGNVRKEYNGRVYDSIKESNMARDLDLMEKAGEIENLVMQNKVILQDGYTDASGKKQRPIYYIADFTFYDKKHKRLRAIDCKGMKTPVFKLKEKMFNNRFKKLGFFIEYEV